MKTIEESVVMAMDGAESNLFPYLPYILQDLWEIGSSPEIIIKLIQKHSDDYSALNILDLGCGKGAVSIKIAKEFKCHCHGIDAIKEFICEAQKKSKEYDVQEYCHFEIGDIRTKLSDLKSYDIIILGAIGPVFGNYYSTLSTISKHVTQNGVIIIDDGYFEDGSNYSHPLMEERSIILKQIADAGMKLTDEVIITKNEIKESDDYIFKRIKKRCQELIKKHPDNHTLFKNYIRKQEEENAILENKVICSTMLIGKVINQLVL